MSKLRSVNTFIWQDTWFENLKPNAKLLFIYFITNERTNMLGIYEISLKKVSFETGLSIKDVEEIICLFQKDNKVSYRENRVILLNFLKHQNYNFNMKKSAIDAYNELPESLKIENQLVIDKTINGFETLAKGFGMVRKVEMEYELEKEVEVENSIINVRFDKFWNLYDKKTGKEKTEKAFLKLNESEISTIFIVLKKYIESTPDKKFRKDPLTWINGKHFNDEIFIPTKQTQSAHNKLTL